MRPRRRRNENGETPSDARPENEARSSTPAGQDGSTPNQNNSRPGNRSSQRRGRGPGRERQSNPGNRMPENAGGTTPSGDMPNGGAPNRNTPNSNQATNPNQDRNRQPGNQHGRGRQGRRRGPSGGRQNRPTGEGNAPTNEPQSPVMENSGAPRDPQAPDGAQPRRDGQGGRGRRQQSGRRQQQGRQQPAKQDPARQESGRQESGRQDSNRQEPARQDSGRQPAERQNNRNPRRGPGRGQQRRPNPRPALPTERSFSPEDEKPNNRPNRRERAPIERTETAEPSAQGNRQGQRGRQNNGRSRRPNERSSWGGGERYVSIDKPLPTTPIRTNRGIKARSQRGQFSKNWWARRWIESMEQLVDPGRLQRGRSYARSGQVLSLQETQNGIEAKVQGSRPQPYKVVIQVTPLTNDQWDQVIDALSEQALFTAQLLAGEMPADIEDAFNTAQVSLFPIRSGDLFTSCSCPDWANPCKHVAATHYILGDRFDDDPFLLFRMRGRSQEEILQALRARRAGQGEAAEMIEEPEVQPEQALALEDQIEHFWEPAESLDTFPLTIRPASIDMPLLKRMGEPAFLVGDPLETLLKPAYDTFMRSALLAAYSDEEPLESSNGNGNGNGDSHGHDELE